MNVTHILFNKRIDIMVENINGILFDTSIDFTEIEKSLNISSSYEATSKYDCHTILNHSSYKVEV